jgi:hypothetical protein
MYAIVTVVYVFAVHTSDDAVTESGLFVGWTVVASCSWPHRWLAVLSFSILARPRSARTHGSIPARSTRQPRGAPPDRSLVQGSSP